MFYRKDVFNSNIVSRSSLPLPTSPPKCSSVEVKKERFEMCMTFKMCMTVPLQF